MMQGWYYVENLTGQRHGTVQIESQIATVLVVYTTDCDDHSSHVFTKQAKKQTKKKLKRN